MKLPWYLRQHPTVTLMAGLGGLFIIVNQACAQPWAATTAPTQYWKALAASADGTRLVAAEWARGYCFPCSAPIYVSADAGSTWALTSAPGNDWSSVAASADGTRLVAAAAADPTNGVGDGLIYTSLDAGATWSPTRAPSNNWGCVACSADGIRLVAVSGVRHDALLQTNLSESGIYVSGNSGASWIRTSAPSNFWSAVASSADGIKLVAAGLEYICAGLVYTSTNSGATWTPTTAPSENWISVACSADGVKLVAAAAGDGLIYTSLDAGAIWTPTTAPSNNWTSVACSADGAILWATATDPYLHSGNGLIYMSSDTGLTWTATGAPTSFWRAVACSADGFRAVAADDTGGLLCTYPYSRLWRLADAPAQPWGAVASSADGTKLVAAGYGGEAIDMTVVSGPIYASTDGGTTWTPTEAPINTWTSVASSADGTKLVAVTRPYRDSAVAVGDGAIYRSLNSGATWTRTSAPSNYWFSVASSVDGEKLVAAPTPWLGDGRIYTSGDSGVTWTPTTAPSVGWLSVASSADGARLIAAEWSCGSGRIYISGDSGQTWTPTSAPSNTWSSVASSADGIKLIAVAAADACAACWGAGLGDGLIYTSANSGATWTSTTAPSNNWVSVSSSADGTKLAVLVDNNSFGFNQSCIYSSSDSGATWVRSDSPAVRGWNAVASSADGNHVVAVGSDGIYILGSPAPAPPLPPSPRLVIDRSGANLALSWLVPSSRFVLQQSPDLRPANWTDVPGAPALDYTNLHYRVTLTPSLTRAYYRLRQQ